MCLYYKYLRGSETSHLNCIFCMFVYNYYTLKFLSDLIFIYGTQKRIFKIC